MFEVQNIMIKPGIYIVSTPIGNLKDITIRALEILKSVDLILCENTRNSLKLLSHYNITTKLGSYNDHSDQRTRDKIINLAHSGKSIALISDAGTPLISDPGYKLAKEAYDKDIYVSSCPGACAAINALILSGLATDHFYFEGFLPPKIEARNLRLETIKRNNFSTIIYETSKKLNVALTTISNHFGDIKIVLVREMTKQFEERIYKKISEIIDIHSKSPLKGEIVLLIPKQDASAKMNEVDDDIKKLLRDKTNSTKDIVKILSFKYPKLSKKLLYSMIIKD